MTPQKSQTPDERFLSKAYHTAQQTGHPQNTVDSRIVAKAVGLKETATKNIIKHLAQANFVKKVSETHITLTPHGCKFVEDNS